MGHHFKLKEREKREGKDPIGIKGGNYLGGGTVFISLPEKRRGKRGTLPGPSTAKNGSSRARKKEKRTRDLGKKKFRRARATSGLLREPRRDGRKGGETETHDVSRTGETCTFSRKVWTTLCVQGEGKRARLFVQCFSPRTNAPADQSFQERKRKREREGIPLPS